MNKKRERKKESKLNKENNENQTVLKCLIAFTLDPCCIWTRNNKIRTIQKIVVEISGKITNKGGKIKIKMMEQRSEINEISNRFWNVGQLIVVKPS